MNIKLYEGKIELVSKELYHLAAILHVYAGVLIFMMATLPAGYIPQWKVPSASSSGSLDFIVFEVF